MDCHQDTRTLGHQFSDSLHSLTGKLADLGSAISTYLPHGTDIVSETCTRPNLVKKRNLEAISENVGDTLE